METNRGFWSRPLGWIRLSGSAAGPGSNHSTPAQRRSRYFNCSQHSPAVASDTQFLRNLRHPQLAWNTPLSASHADRLLENLRLTEADRVVDLGCGRGELLLRAVADVPGLIGEGVELDYSNVERARSAAVARGLADRVTFTEQDLRNYRRTAGRVICIGADHVWGGPVPALSSLQARVEPSGRLLFGGGFWSRSPSPELVEMFGDLPATLEALLAASVSAGWKVDYHDIADLREWDDFETAWNRDLEDISRREPSTVRGQQADRIARQRREEYYNGYRGVLGFAYLILAHAERSRPGR